MSDGGRIDYLDGIRGLAIGAVLALHWLATYIPLFHGGAVGVDIFFVLSGFIISTLLWRRPGGSSLAADWWSFIVRRVARLYPALVGVVVGATVLYAITPGAPADAVTVLARGLVVLVQGMSLWAATLTQPEQLPALYPFVHTWSLAVEWYFYLLWPIVVLVARRRGVSAARLALGSLVAGVVLYAASLTLGYPWFYFGPSARCGELLVGGALALWFQAGRAPTAPWRHADVASAAAVLAVGAIVLFGPHSGEGVFHRYVGVPVTVLCTALVIYTGYSNPGGLVHRLVAHPWLALVGRLSYSLYLWHEVPMFVLEDAWPDVPKPVVGVVVIVGTVVFTALSYHLLERPFLKGRSSTLRGARVEPSASPPPALDGAPLGRGLPVTGCLELHAQAPAGASPATTGAQGRIRSEAGTARR